MSVTDKIVARVSRPGTYAKAIAATLAALATALGTAYADSSLTTVEIVISIIGALGAGAATYSTTNESE